MILFLEPNGFISGHNKYLVGMEAEAFIKSWKFNKVVKYDGEYDFDGDGKAGYAHAHFYDEDTETIRVEYTEIVPVEPEPEKALTETEQAILQTAITVEYVAALQEMTLGF